MKLNPQVKKIAINTNQDHQHYASLNIPIIFDKFENSIGPLAGIHAGMDYALNFEHNPPFTHIVSVATDSPFFPSDMVYRFIKEVDHNTCVIMAKSVNRHHPIFALWPVKILRSLEQWLETTDHYKIISFAEKHHLKYVDFI